MNLKLLLVLLVLSLPACAVHTMRADSHASDLDVLEANVKRAGAPVLLPNGKEFCAELARTQDDLDDCAGFLEDGLYESNRRAESLVGIVVRFIRRERLRRDPCSWWERLTRDARCTPDRP